jgi:hypothetical protein
MQSSFTSPPLGNSDLEPNPTFEVTIAYEDFETGKHAKKTYEYLVKHVGHDCQFASQMWKFDVLGIPKLRDMAARDALAADVIIIASHGGKELPREVISWIDTWSARKGNAIALVALFDCEPQDGRAIREYLAGVAKRCQMEFFAQPEQQPLNRIQEKQSAFNRTTSLSGRTLSTLAGVVRGDVGIARWGLNE